MNEELASRIGADTTLIDILLRPNGKYDDRVKIEDDLARHIERAFDLPPSWLDGFSVNPDLLGIDEMDLTPKQMQLMKKVSEMADEDILLADKIICFASKNAHSDKVQPIKDFCEDTTCKCKRA